MEGSGIWLGKPRSPSLQADWKHCEHRVVGTELVAPGSRGISGEPRVGGNKGPRPHSRVPRRTEPVLTGPPGPPRAALASSGQAQSLPHRRLPPCTGAQLVTSGSRWPDGNRPKHGLRYAHSCCSPESMWSLLALSHLATRPPDHTATLGLRGLSVGEGGPSPSAGPKLRAHAPWGGRAGAGIQTQTPRVWSPSPGE